MATCRDPIGPGILKILDRTGTKKISDRTWRSNRSLVKLDFIFTDSSRLHIISTRFDTDGIFSQNKLLMISSYDRSLILFFVDSFVVLTFICKISVAGYTIIRIFEVKYVYGDFRLDLMIRGNRKFFIRSR